MKKILLLFFVSIIFIGCSTPNQEPVEDETEIEETEDVDDTNEQHLTLDTTIHIYPPYTTTPPVVLSSELLHL